MAVPRPLRMIALPSRHHVYGSFAILVFIALVMSCQVTDRTGFADADLHRDVIDRWGAPIVQAAPSVRYVSSGSVFSKLTPLPLEAQRLAVDARMNYRKRGLVSFSGFDFETGLQVVDELKALLPPGMSLPQFALRWIEMHDAVTCSIPGAKRPDQVSENIAALALPPLASDVMRRVKEIYDARVRPAVHQRW